MSTWYEKAVFYHMYPLGMTGAPREHTDDTVVNRFEELDRWIPHMQELGCNAVYIGPLFESSSHGLSLIHICGLSISSTPTIFPAPLCRGITISELDALSQAICPGNSCTFLISMTASSDTAVPHTDVYKRQLWKYPRI